MKNVSYLGHTIEHDGAVPYLYSFYQGIAADGEISYFATVLQMDSEEPTFPDFEENRADILYDGNLEENKIFLNFMARLQGQG